MTGRPLAGSRPPGVVNRWGALVAVSLATLMMLLDFMAVAVALPAVRHSLNASFPELEWVLEAFVLTLAALVLTAGHITDIVGRRPVFLGGLVVFAIGSVLGGLAQTPYALIGARVVQGIGGALLFATGSVLLTETFRHARGRAALAVWGTVTGIAVASSPLLGGEIASTLGWRWLFWLDVPVSVLALLIGFVAIKEPLLDQGGATVPGGATVQGGATAPRASKRPAKTDGRDNRVPMVDWRGLVLFTAAMAILVIGLVRSTTSVQGFSSNGVLACFLMTGLLLTAFVAWETVARAPMLDVSLFRQRTFTGSSIAAFGLSMAVLGPVLCLVVYMSFDQGYSELTIGTHLLLLTGVTLPFLPLTGFLDKYIPVKLLICSGLTLVATGLWLMSRLSTTGSLSELVPGLIVAGVGLELVNPRLASAAAATVRPALAAGASRTISTIRQIGTATGVAVFGAIFATQLSDHISERTAGFPQVANESPSIASLVLDGHTAQAVSSTPAAVRSQIVPIIQTGFAGAVHDVFFVAAFVALASAVLALSTRSSDVPRTGASQLRSLSSVGDGSGNGATPGRTTAPSANGARPEPAVAAAPGPETSTAATLAALGITVATPTHPDELTSLDELTTGGELARLRELAAPVADAPVADALVADALVADAPVADAPVADALATEPEAAPLPRSIARIPAVQAWPGWAGWQAPDEEPGNDVGPTVLADVPVASQPADEAVPALVPSVPADAAVPPLPVQRQPGEDALEGTPKVTVADFLSSWRGAEQGPAPVGPLDDLAETGGPGVANGSVVNGTGPEDEIPTGTGPEDDVVNTAGPEDEVLTGAAPEDAGGPIAVTIGRRWVRGQVTTAAGEPLAGALVTLVTADGDEAGHAIAGSDGSFAVGDVGEGTYTLIAAAPHFRPAASTFALSSEEAAVMINLLGIGSITGKVTAAKDGSPMTVDIELVCRDGDVAAQYRTGKDGRFSLTDLVEGSYELVVPHGGYRTAEVPIVVDRGQTLTIDVAMVGVGHIYGAVTGPGGGWVPGAQVTLADGSGRVVATTGTDGAGSYRFSGIPEGPYTVHAPALGGAFSAVEVQAGSTVAADVNLASL